MPEIDVRPVTKNDIDDLSAFEHGYYSEYVWQMAMDFEPQNLQAAFRRVRLPRRISVAYPRNKEKIFLALDQAEAFLLAEFNQKPVGYIKVLAEKEAKLLRITDLVVAASMRRQGIGSGLILTVMSLASSRGFISLMLEMQSKNDPAVAMASKMGFVFCGFRDHYFPNQELALFYSRFIR
ncbi:GNAT family N-acetyltransferase [bacterium]|nr:GNAT family N-acetyltransferase [bacterium]